MRLVKNMVSDDEKVVAALHDVVEKNPEWTLKRLAKKGVTFEAVMAELSEDPGSAKNGQSYEVTPEAGLVKPFLIMSLRLNVGELGVVRTEFGMHIIKRVE